MSATGRTAVYRDHAAYDTPPELAAAIVHRLPFAREAIVFEPHVGNGVFIRALRRHSQDHDLDLRLSALDVDPTAAGLSLFSDVFSKVVDFASPDLFDFFRGVGARDRPDWIIGNPPYAEAESGRRVRSVAECHVRQALKLVVAGGSVVFLLRLAFLESEERVEFWRMAPLRHVLVLVQRPSFTSEGKTDSCAYGVFWFTEGWRQRPTLGLLKWR